MSNRQVVVIGLDGGTWDLIGPWTREGELPTIKQLLENGVHCNLLSTVPSYTLPSWTSLITGVNPGKHGLYDIFLHYGKVRKIVSSQDRKARSVFDILGDYGKTCVAVNIPGTFPPDRINGAMVSGILTTPGKNSDFVYPNSLKQEIANFFNKSFHFENDKLVRYLSASDKVKLVNAINEVAELEVTATLTLLDMIKPDLLWHVFRTTDLLQHYLYKSKDLENENNRYLLEHYRKIDSLISTIINNQGTETSVLIVSDHGFAPLKKYFHINTWLKDRGLLKTKHNWKKPPLLWTAAQAAAKTRSTNIGKFVVDKIVPSLLGTKVMSKLIEKTISPLDSIDFQESKAYCPSGLSQAVRILAVDEAERKQLITEIVSGLYQVKDPETGEPVLEKVLKTEDVYCGDYVFTAPDILLVTREGYIVTAPFSNNNGQSVCAPVSLAGTKTGDHTPEGIFIASGEGIKNTGEINPLSVYDVTPAILQLFGIATPGYMDGLPNEQVLTEETMAARLSSSSERERLQTRIRELKQKGKL